MKRHFWDMGKDTDRDEFGVVGIGDMGGDVFGNGMLLSRKIRLLAAFNHLHIFLDPDPDPERSFVERERLFRLRARAGPTMTPNCCPTEAGSMDRHASSSS